MKDNLSIIVTMLVFVILIVIFPLYNYFERQDDMSYNIVLKSTTNFVDEVINCGYIDQQMYDNFIQKLSITGNLYDIQLEAHKRTYTKDPYNMRLDTFIEQYNIDYNNDIFDQGTGVTKQSNVSVDNKVLKNGVYYLNVGDQIYVKLKNSGTTMAGAIFNIIVPTSKQERVTVNYGGIIKNNAWEKQDISNLFQKDIYTEIYVDKAVTPGLTNKINDRPTYSLNESSEIKVVVKILNYEKSQESNIANILKDNLKITGFESKKTILPTSVIKSASSPEWVATYNVNSISSSVEEYFGGNTYKTCQVELEPDLIQGNYFKNSLTSSDTFVIKKNNTDTATPDITGAYLNGSSSVVNNIEIGSTVIYYLNYYDSTLIASANEMKNYISATNFTYDDLVVQHDSGSKRFKLTFSNVSGEPDVRIKINVAGDWAQYSQGGTIKKVGTLSSRESTLKFLPKNYTTPGIYKFVIPSDGRYRLEVVGANGGGNANYSSNRGSRGGKGGRTAGTIALTKGQVLYIVVGGSGKSAISGSVGTGGYNGGGNGTKSLTDNTKFGFGGGGATDIRLSDTNISSPIDGLSKRIIVAGGGGGADDIDIDGTTNSGVLGSIDDGSGGFGAGGLNNGGYGFVDGSVSGGAKPGTTTSGFSLGIGQNASSSNDAGGGGGGYYGGFASPTSNSNSGGAGGSGYIAAGFIDIVGANGVNSSTIGNGSASITYMGK